MESQALREKAGDRLKIRTSDSYSSEKELLPSNPGSSTGLERGRAAILRAYDVSGSAKGILHEASLTLTTNSEIKRCRSRLGNIN